MLQKVCCVCGEVYEEVELPGVDDVLETSGYCASCYKKEIIAIKEGK